MRFLVINGPNLNRLGKRDPTHYGSMTLPKLNAYVRAELKKLGIKTTFFQSGCEGKLISRIYRAQGRYDGILLNAGAYTHYSYALRDAAESVSVPLCEVHLSDVAQRESFRQFSVFEGVAVCMVKGLKEDSYVQAAIQLKDYILAKV